MGIEIALYDGHPKRSRLPARELHLSTAHGGALAEALAAHAAPGTRLAGIDPYGDTVLGEQDAAAAFEEASALLARCTTEPHRAAVRDLRNLLANCASTPGSWLIFYGD